MGGARSFLSLLWLPDGMAVAPPAGGGFRSFTSLLWLPDGMHDEGGGPGPGSVARFIPTFRRRRR